MESSYLINYPHIDGKLPLILYSFFAAVELLQIN